MSLENHSTARSPVTGHPQVLPITNARNRSGWHSVTGTLRPFAEWEACLSDVVT